MKFRLSATVVFSALIGYLLGSSSPAVSEIILLVLGGLLVTGGANTFNQILEHDYDKKMKRTATRPIPSGDLSVTQSFLFASIICILGLYLLQLINNQCSFFGLLSVLIYVLIYTPLKRLSPISIFIGAFPGAIPILLGWVAATNDFGLAAGILFAIQFCWQFPHFIAISWVLDEEYKDAGFKMLISGKKGKTPPLVAVFTSTMMTLISILPFFLLINQLKLSIYSTIVIFIIGILFTSKTILFLQKRSDLSARKVLLNSYVYLPVMQLIYVLDKFLIQ